MRFEAADVPVWTSGFSPPRGPVRGALGTDEAFRLPSPADVTAFREAFAEAAHTTHPSGASKPTGPARLPYET